MSKINLNAVLKSDEENLEINTAGIKTDNKIIYKENDIIVTILIFNNRIEINRSCIDYKINLVFEKNKKTISTYNVFGASKIFELETICKELLIKDKEIKVEYELEGNSFSYLLKIGG